MSNFNGDIERAARGDPYARARVDQHNLERSFRSHNAAAGSRSRAGSNGSAGGLVRLLLAGFALYLVVSNFPGLFGDAGTGEAMLFLATGLIVLIALIRFFRIFLVIAAALLALYIFRGGA